MAEHRIFAMPVAKVYPFYVAKAEKKGRTKAEVDQVIRWLTGYSQAKLEAALKKQVSFKEFFAQAPKLNPARALVKGVVCGVRAYPISPFTRWAACRSNSVTPPWLWVVQVTSKVL